MAPCFLVALGAPGVLRLGVCGCDLEPFARGREGEGVPQAWELHGFTPGVPRACTPLPWPTVGAPLVSLCVCVLRTGRGIGWGLKMRGIGPPGVRVRLRVWMGMRCDVR